MSSINACQSTRPVMTDVGFVEPTLANWAHLVVEPLESTHGSIFLGPQQTAGKQKFAALKEVSPPVGAIVNCTNVFPNHHEEDGSITYCRIAIYDEGGANILVYLGGAAKFIHHQVTQGRSVLVHCSMGVSRSSTIVIAYLMQYHSMSLVEAYTHVKKRRPMINPNPGFWRQLEIFGQRLQHKNSSDRSVTPAEGTEFDKDWAETSLATYQTLGHIVANNPSELFYEITTGYNMADILFVAVDYHFGRGIIDADLPWLSALCGTFRDLGADPVPMIETMFTEESNFMEMWAGEIYPERIEKIKAASLASV